MSYDAQIVWILMVFLCPFGAWQLLLCLNKQQVQQNLNMTVNKQWQNCHFSVIYCCNPKRTVSVESVLLSLTIKYPLQEDYIGIQGDSVH